jgi:hypothetical protein
MGNVMNLGKCGRCGQDVLSARGRKDHAVGEPSRKELHRYRHGMSL